MKKNIAWNSFFSDPPLVFGVCFLCFTGLNLVFSSTSHHPDPFLLFKKHGLSLLWGCLAFFIFTQIPLNWLRKYSWLLLASSIFLLILVLVPGFGVKSGGAIRWLKLGSVRIGQPAELTKLALVLFLAHLLSKKQDSIRTFKHGFLPPIIVVLFIFLLLMKQPDFGTSMLIVGIMFVMLFIAGVRKTYLVGSALIGSPIVYILISAKEYRWNRMVAFLDPLAPENIRNVSYQLVQSIKAFASGGLFGLGAGASTQKIGYLPEAHTDFIFAILGEEFGLTGVLAVILAFLFVISRGIRISSRATDPFERLLALGISTFIAFQGMINMGVVMGALPTKGMPMPFLSFARTSQIVILACIGLLIQIESNNQKNRKT